MEGKMKKLKSCPFCKGKARIITTRDQNDNFTITYCVVECEDCLARSAPGYGKEDIPYIIRMWNNRHRKMPWRRWNKL